MENESRSDCASGCGVLTDECDLSRLERIDDVRAALEDLVHHLDGDAAAVISAAVPRVARMVNPRSSSRRATGTASAWSSAGR